MFPNEIEASNPFLYCFTDALYVLTSLCTLFQPTNVNLNILKRRLLNRTLNLDSLKFTNRNYCNVKNIFFYIRFLLFIFCDFFFTCILVIQIASSSCMCIVIHTPCVNVTNVERKSLYIFCYRVAGITTSPRARLPIQTNAIHFYFNEYFIICFFIYYNLYLYVFHKNNKKAKYY